MPRGVSEPPHPRFALGSGSRVLHLPNRIQIKTDIAGFRLNQIVQGKE